jgi:hypothetical protein
MPVPELLEAVDRIVAATHEISRGTRRTWDTPALVA